MQYKNILKSIVVLGLFTAGSLECSQLYSQTKAQPSSAECERSWTDIDGRKIVARLVEDLGDSVVLERSDGKRGPVPKTRLCASDLHFVSTAVGTQQPAESEVDKLNKALAVLDLPEVIQTEEKLLSESVRDEVRTQTKQVTRLVAEYYLETYYHRGRCYTRTCCRWVPVTELVQESVTERVQLLERQTVLDNPRSNIVGVGHVTVNFSAIPKGAGARASKVVTVNRSLLPTGFLASPSNVDRALVGESANFTPRKDAPNSVEKIKVVAVVSENDAVVKLDVLIAIKSGEVFNDNKKELTEIAQKLAEAMAERLRQAS